MRLAIVAIALLMPTAAADHATGHVEIPGGEAVSFALERASNATGIGSIGNFSDLLPHPASCSAYTQVRGHYVLGLPLVPRDVEHAYVACHAGNASATTPDLGPYA